MKKIIPFLLLIIAGNLFAQTKEEINNILELKKIISETNRVFLNEIFENKYIKNANYFKETDLALEKNTEKFKNSNVLINSIKVEASTSVIDLCNKILDFNTNYLRLFTIKDEVISKKFDSANVQEAIRIIDSLPELESGSKLNITKSRMLDLLKNYKESTCSLKASLDKLKTRKDPKALLPQYIKLENNPLYKDYPYLMKVIADMKASVISYTEDDLQPCVVN